MMTFFLCKQIGFLLGSCGVSVALTSEACFKGIPKTSAGEVVSFKGWPKLTWFITDHLPKPPKEWQTPPRHSDDSPAYIEVCRQRIYCYYSNDYMIVFMHQIAGDGRIYIT